ncbi:M20/M25/M40 family metallo-hydrolase [Zavarzinella formosa]|uniref:M20/M25/M40 family metallo-hydrolase n=1 Tax=Zavarzinella formosa TaxID=360055 RepID=UPI000361E5AD|nr:M20/M25/M40 family metallo-hydrolase [Zavarzinella formosa]
MRRLLLFILLFAPAPVFAQEGGDKLPAISTERIRADVKYLASEPLQGRGVGTRGEELTTDHIAAEFKKAGLKPGGDRGTYFQGVPLVTVKTGPELSLELIKGKEGIPLKAEEEFVGVSHTQVSEDFDAEAIFVGHGISAPEFGWDDYKDTDVKGKVVVLFTNEPPSDDPKFFNGKSLTYYGRWTYKYEEATRRGAKAVFIIHTPETAGYPYSVVKSVKGVQLQREPNAPALAFAGWLSAKGGDKVLYAIGLTVDEALKKADTKGFKPIPLDTRFKVYAPTTTQKIISKNVIGVVEGSDPALKSEYVLFSAHWDHLGVRKSTTGGEEVYHGALDNASGSAILLELARAWAAMDPKPKRSALFLATTAEESGLLGAHYYAAHPAVPLGKTAMNFNFDCIYPVGEPESIVLSGAERTTAWKALQATAAKHGLVVEPDQRSHLGFYYRSDHFALGRGGVPAFSVGRGEKVKGKPADFMKKVTEDFIANIYHTPNDKYREEWDFAAYPPLMRFTLDAARETANTPTLPTWLPGDEFRAAREKSGVK